MRKKILLTVAAALLIGGIALYVMNREPPADTRFTGAYRLDDARWSSLPRVTTRLCASN